MHPISDSLARANESTNNKHAETLGTRHVARLKGILVPFDSVVRFYTYQALSRVDRRTLSSHFQNATQPSAVLTCTSWSPPGTKNLIALIHITSTTHNHSNQTTTKTATIQKQDLPTSFEYIKIMLRQAISKLLLPNLERDIAKEISTLMNGAHTMTDCFLAPSVYAYQAEAAANAGAARAAFASTAARQQRLFKTQYASPGQGLFQ
jgi:hypothetical protein